MVGTSPVNNSQTRVSTIALEGVVLVGVMRSLFAVGVVVLVLLSLTLYTGVPVLLFSSTISSTQSKRLCTRSQIQDGQWVPVELDSPPYISKTTHLRCYPLEFYEKKPWRTWDWLPSDPSCTLSDWNESDLCRLLRYATVSVIGDSLNWEMYSSLLQLLGRRVLQSSQHKSKTERRNHVQMACGRTKFVWRNDPRLENITDSIQTDFPTVLILNRGAHFQNDSTLLPAIRRNIEEVRDWFEFCQRQRNTKCHFFWRTTVPGHPGCENFTEPVNNIESMEFRVANLELYNNQSINFHWYDYHHQNKLVLKLLEESGLEFQVIDAYELNMRRPDEHRAQQGDCLHNCYPGKMDVYNQLLLHYLKMQRSQADTDRLTELFRE